MMISFRYPKLWCLSCNCASNNPAVVLLSLPFSVNTCSISTAVFIQSWWIKETEKNRKESLPCAHHLHRNMFGHFMWYICSGFLYQNGRTKKRKTRFKYQCFPLLTRWICCTNNNQLADRLVCDSEGACIGQLPTRKKVEERTATLNAALFCLEKGSC